MSDVYAAAMTYRRWHRVLAHALLGVDQPELGEQDAPDLDRLVAELSGRRAEALHCWAAAADAERPWPVPPTPELSEGLGWSQYLTALHQLRLRLDLAGAAVAPARGPARDDAESRRLRADRPPHW